MKIDDTVKIMKCDVCSKIIGKVGTITKLNTEGQDISFVEVKFGKGRPQKNRPTLFSVDDVELVGD